MKRSFKAIPGRGIFASDDASSEWIKNNLEKIKSAPVGKIVGVHATRRPGCAPTQIQFFFNPDTDVHVAWRAAKDWAEEKNIPLRSLVPYGFGGKKINSEFHNDFGMIDALVDVKKLEEQNDVESCKSVQAAKKVKERPAEEFPYMINYETDNPTFAYDFQRYAESLGCRKVQVRYQGKFQPRIVYLCPSEEVYEQLKERNIPSIRLISLQKYDPEEYPVYVFKPY